MSKKKKPEVIVGEVVTLEEASQSSIVKVNEMERALAQSMPKWVGEKEDIGNAMYKTAQEIWLVMEDALLKHHGFTEEKLVQLRNQITPVLKGVTEYEEYGLNLTSPFSIDVISDLVNTHLVKEQMIRNDQEYPTQLKAAKPYLKALKEKNRD